MWSESDSKFAKCVASVISGNLRHGSGLVLIAGGLLLTAAAMLASFTGAISLAYAAPFETLVPLLQQAIPNVPGKTLTAISVVFSAGAQAVPHRHGDAFLYAYVLEGEVESQIEGQPAHVYSIGHSWTEQPGDHHVMTKNTSKSSIARLLVVFVADNHAPLKIDDQSQ